jgi:hypothetical protein
VALPDARRRLHLQESVRVDLLARRFPDAICAALDAETGLTWDGRDWLAVAGTRQLMPGGGLAAIAGAVVN